MIIFLDIDGVLNDHKTLVGHYCTFKKECVAVFNIFNHIVKPQVVLSSSWRYIILGGDMTLKGFNYMLISHGIECDLIDHTCADEVTWKREDQISKWLQDNNVEDKYLVFDDLPIPGHPQIKTDGRVGLTPRLAYKAIYYARESSTL